MTSSPLSLAWSLKEKLLGRQVLVKLGFAKNGNYGVLYLANSIFSTCRACSDSCHEFGISVDIYHLTFYTLCSILSLTQPMMKRVPPPVHNALQSYLRSNLGRECIAQTQRHVLCITCLRASGQVGRRHFSSDTFHKRRKLSSEHCYRGLQPHKQEWRHFATVTDLDRSEYGPLKEYDDRVHSRKLRDDEHQRSKIRCRDHKRT